MAPPCPASTAVASVCHAQTCSSSHRGSFKPYGRRPCIAITVYTLSMLQQHFLWQLFKAGALQPRFTGAAAGSSCSRVSSGSQSHPGSLARQQAINMQPMLQSGKRTSLRLLRLAGGVENTLDLELFVASM